MLQLGLLLWALFFFVVFALPILPWWLWLIIIGGGALAAYAKSRENNYK